jgi:sigma-B regulation protein RsbU (phosphoserine phosphatase)
MAPLGPETKYQLLLQISRKISRTLDLQELLDQILDSVRRAIPYDAGGIFVLHESVPVAPGPIANLIAGVSSVGFDLGPADPMLRLGQGIVGHVIRTAETVLARDARSDPRYVAGRPATRSEVAVPIVSNEQVIGALNLESDRRDAFTQDDAELLQFFADAAAIAIEKAMLHRQVLEKERIEGQLRIARQVQAGLLPSTPPELAGYDLAGVNLPTWEIGGDYYDYIPLPDGRLGLVVADVSGKGVPAALIMATFRAALRTELRREGSAPGVAGEMNRLLLEVTGASRFVTAVYGVLDPASGRFSYVNCGHNPPLVLGAGGRRELLETGGPALGLLATATFAAGEVRLAAGEVLALYTDGVVEPADAHDVEFGFDRLESRLRAGMGLPAGDIVLSVVEATRAWAACKGHADDFTLVVVKRVAPPNSAGRMTGGGGAGA